jgi:hypothetical protein
VPVDDTFLGGTGSTPPSDRHAKGLLNPSFLPTHLVFTQSQVRLQLPMDLLHRPSSLIRTHHLSRRPLVQIGRQDFRMLRADATPFFTQDHSDVADVPQTQVFAVYPEGFAALGARQAGHPDALRICARQMCHQVFDGLVLDGSPGARNGEHKTPSTGRIGGALLNHLHIVLGAIGGGALDDKPCGPGWRAKAAHHRAKQHMLRSLHRLQYWDAYVPRALITPCLEQSGMASI